MRGKREREREGGSPMAMVNRENNPKTNQIFGPGGIYASIFDSRLSRYGRNNKGRQCPLARGVGPARKNGTEKIVGLVITRRGDEDGIPGNEKFSFSPAWKRGCLFL